MNAGLIGKPNPINNKSGVWDISDIINRNIDRPQCVGYKTFGSPTISDGVITALNNTSGVYIPYPFWPGNTSWQMEIKFKLSSYSADNYANLFEQKVVNRATPQISINPSSLGSTFQISVSYTKSSWNIGQNSTFVPDLDVNYWVKFGYTTSKYFVSVSTDSNSFTEVLSVSSLTPCYQGNDSLLSIGAGGSSATDDGFFRGEIDLKKTQIYIGDRLWWRAI